MSTTGWVWTIIIIIIIVLGGWYAYSMMSGSTAAPYTNTTTTTTGASTTTTGNSVFMTANDAAKGAYMADVSGRTLYTYDKDTAGVSNCSGACLQAWPAYTAGSQSDLPNGISVITRSDGSMQYAYNGKPLYYYAEDTGPNMITGDGVGGVWHIVKL